MCVYIYTGTYAYTDVHTTRSPKSLSASSNCCLPRLLGFVLDLGSEARLGACEEGAGAACQLAMGQLALGLDLKVGTRAGLVVFCLLFVTDRTCLCPKLRQRLGPADNIFVYLFRGSEPTTGHRVIGTAGCLCLRLAGSVI